MIYMNKYINKVLKGIYDDKKEGTTVCSAADTD